MINLNEKEIINIIYHLTNYYSIAKVTFSPNTEINSILNTINSLQNQLDNINEI